MRKLLVVLMAVAFTACLSSDAEAQSRQRRVRRAYRPQARYYRPVFQSRQVQGRGFFGNLMELERRKNAWLAQTFLRR